MQQVTFSIWPDTASMAEFARRPGGPHAEAIRAVREGAWFREELYARFRILGDAGSWQGASPLAQLEFAA
jgi:spheroidene monooxygenase